MTPNQLYHHNLIRRNPVKETSQKTIQTRREHQAKHLRRVQVRIT